MKMDRQGSRSGPISTPSQRHLNATCLDPTGMLCLVRPTLLMPAKACALVPTEGCDSCWLINFLGRLARGKALPGTRVSDLTRSCRPNN